MKYVYLNAMVQIIAIHETRVDPELYASAGFDRLAILPPEFVRYDLSAGYPMPFLAEGWEDAAVADG